MLIRHELSGREEEVVNLAAQGLTDNGIAHKLGISPGTVNGYWARIRSKLGQRSRTELVAVYLQTANAKAIESIKASA